VVDEVASDDDDVGGDSGCAGNQPLSPLRGATHVQVGEVEDAKTRAARWPARDGDEPVPNAKPRWFDEPGVGKCYQADDSNDGEDGDDHGVL